MKHRPLQTLFLRIGRNVDSLSRHRIDSGIKHAGGQRPGRGVKILHLIRDKAIFLQKHRQFAGVFQRSSRMRRDEIRDYKLFLAQTSVFRRVFLAEFFKYAPIRLVHALQHIIGNVLRRYLESSADMMFAQFPQKIVAGVCEHIIETNAGTDEDLFHPRQTAQRPENFDIFPMVYFHIAADLRVKAVPVSAYAMLQLLFTGRLSEISCGAAHIVNIAFKLRIRDEDFGFANQRILTPALNPSALMKCQRTKAAPAEAAPNRSQTEFHFLQSRNPSVFFVGRMIRPLVRKFVHIVQFQI